jgi:hypothetical protein
MEIFKDENQAIEWACKHLKCNASEGVTESDSNGCYGCDACEKLVADNYHKIIGEPGNYEHVLTVLARAVEEGRRLEREEINKEVEAIKLTYTCTQVAAKAHFGRVISIIDKRNKTDRSY